MSPATPYGRSSTRLLLAMIGASALVLSLFMSARPALAADGNIAIFKTMCDSIGKQDTCNGRDSSLDGYHIDYQVHEGDENGTVVQTIVVTLGENAGGGGNTGGGSQGRAEGAALPGGDYTVCEIPIAYLDPNPDVPLDVLARPEASGGGSTGGNQTQVGDDCIHFTLGTGTEELKYLDQQLEPEGTGSIEILKTDDGDPAAALAGAEFTVEGVDGSFTTADDGTFCVDGLELQSTVTVTETAAPDGYELADPASQEVTVTVEGMCDEREDGPDATFVNPAIVVEPPTPSLVIDKVADTETITISGDTATPSVVTWTLTYTLTDGPVTNAIITDDVPDGFTFLDASDGGTFAGGEVTWTLPSPLTASGSVSFRTTVDVATISRTAPTTNTAVIDSEETEPDDGQDSVTVSSSGTEAGNPTPAQSPAGDLPDTAMGQFAQMPVTWISLAFIAAVALMFVARVAQRR